LYNTIRYYGDYVEILDQTLLPHKEVYQKIYNYTDLIEAIKSLKVRGAPLIGICGAYALALGIINYKGKDDEFSAYLYNIASKINLSRPTAVNLSWALNRLLNLYETLKDQLAPLSIIKECLIGEVILIHEEDSVINKKIGVNGSFLLEDKKNILTHCNAGALATSAYGTAISVIRQAAVKNKNIHVYVDETRPLLQGSRLTAWELAKENINFTIICDNMAAHLMSKNLVDAVIVGADRIAQNGDTANKIGTYNLAILTSFHKIPFYVAAPLSTIDFDCKDGFNIPIEERSGSEILKIKDLEVSKSEFKTYNPAFDVSPASLITAIITEKSIVYPPYSINLKKN